MSGNLYRYVKLRAMPYLINTLFDAFFTMMGIVIGTAFSAILDLRSIMGTIVIVSLSLGVSSGFSVYDAETLQDDPDDTKCCEDSRRVTLFSSLLVFITPFLAGLITLIPFVLVYRGALSIGRGVHLAIGVDLFLIFVTGYVFVVENRFMKGIRMMFLGILMFTVGYLLNNLL